MKSNQTILKLFLYFILLVAVFSTVGISVLIAYEYIFSIENISEKNKKYIFMFLSALFMLIIIYFWKLLSNKFLNKK
jgi:purine-cytosine permease-like protein